MTVSAFLQCFDETVFCHIAMLPQRGNAVALEIAFGDGRAVSHAVTAREDQASLRKARCAERGKRAIWHRKDGCQHVLARPTQESSESHEQVPLLLLLLMLKILTEFQNVGVCLASSPLKKEDFRLEFSINIERLKVDLA